MVLYAYHGLNNYHSLFPTGISTHRKPITPSSQEKKSRSWKW
jgi:hypothetical protein